MKRKQIDTTNRRLAVNAADFARPVKAQIGRVRLRASILIIALAGSILTVPAAQAARAPSKIDPDASCSTGDCHAEVGTKRYVHAAVQAGECQMCHEPKGNKHDFKSMPDSPKLCSMCHEPMDTGANVHMPVSEDCLVCHSPHESNVPKLLVAANQKDLCFGCHDESIMAGKYQHGPAAVGACTVCHNPHSSNEEKFLLASGNDLCAICHTDFIQDLTSGTYVHEPVKDSCFNCHNPHSGPAAKMLPGTAQELCGKCHEAVVNTATSALVNHEPVLAGKACLNCHAPHNAEIAPQLKAPQVDLCLGCHDRPVKSGDKELTDMKGLFARNPDWHGPIREGGCTGCHEPHGGSGFRLLVEPYPAKFYSPYDPENYALCFTCHESATVKNEFTRTLTGFRDGDRNLHFLHVNKEERGRTCRACHEVHASVLPRHIRDTVPYGSWELPINFEKSENGGSCQPGCHVSVTYDRNKRP